MARWTGELRKDPEVFGELAPWWNDQPIVRCNPYLRTEVLQGWEDGWFMPGSTLRVAVLSRDDQPVAALPLFRCQGRYRSIGASWVEPFDVVGATDPEVVAFLPRWLDGLSYAVLNRVRGSSPIVALLDSAPRWRERRSWDAPFIDLSEGIVGVRVSLGSNLMRKLRRRERRLRELGELSFVHLDTFDADLAESGLELEAAGWKGRDGVAMLHRPRHLPWFRHLTEALGELGFLRMSGLYLEDRLVAFAHDVDGDGERLSTVSSYEEAHDVARCSPGLLLLEDILDRASSQGVGAYQLGGDPAPWKEAWASGWARTVDLQVFGSGVAGRVLRAWSGLRS